MRKRELFAVYGAGQWWVVGQHYRRPDHAAADEAKIVDVDIQGTCIFVRFDDGVEIEMPYLSGGGMSRAARDGRV